MISPILCELLSSNCMVKMALQRRYQARWRRPQRSRVSSTGRTSLPVTLTDADELRCGAASASSILRPPLYIVCDRSHNVWSTCIRRCCPGPGKLRGRVVPNKVRYSKSKSELVLLIHKSSRRPITTFKTRAAKTEKYREPHQYIYLTE